MTPPWLIPISWKHLPPLESHATQLWCLERDTWRAKIDYLFSTLSPAERQRAERFYFPADRERFVMGRGLLRHLLAHHTGREPAALTFEAAPHGKPYLADNNVEFNVSHAGELVLIGLNAAHPLGVDVSRVAPLKTSMMDLAQRHFAPAEIDYWRAHPRPVRVFHHIWARKEAVIKATGAGLSADLKAFAVPLSDLNLDQAVHPHEKVQHAFSAPDSSPWTLHAAMPDEQHALAVVTTAPAQALHVYQPHLSASNG